MGRINEGVGGGGFDESVAKKVGDGVDMLFLHDRWIGGFLSACVFVGCLT